MKNIIRINLDVNERNESNIGIPLPQKVIRSKDTAVIIEMRIIGYDVNDGYTFTLLSEYTKSKRHTLYTIGDRLKIEGNVVTFVPPAELISTLEIVTNTLYIEKSGVSLDFSKFHYLAQLSEVDNTVGPVKEVYDDNYQALIDELEFKYMLIEDLTAEYVAAQVAEARVGEDGTIYRFLKERLDVEHQKVTAQVGEVSNQLELTNNEIIDARGGKPTLRVRLNEIDRVDETGKHWTLIDGEWEERVGQSQLINVHGEVAWAMAEAEQAREDAIKAYEDAVAEAKRAADIEDALIRSNIQQGLSAVETEMTTAKQEAKDAANQALTDAKAHADAGVQASKEHFDGLIEEVESEVADAQATADSAVNQIDTAVTNAGFTSLDETISSVQSISNQAQINASTAIDSAQDAMSSASTAISDASQAKADAQAAITEAGEAVDSANTAKTNAQTALADAQTALSTARNADTAANTAKTNAQTAIDDAQSALTTAGNAKTTADTLSIKVDDLEGEVELKASQTEVDGISGTVSTHTTTLSQHATAISSKAESELVDTIKGTVDTHTTEISQNATDIASKANTTTVNTLTGRVDTAESNISQNATAITQRVTTTTYNTGIANKENTVLKQTTAPTHVNGRLWLDTSVTPNILKRSNGTTWIKATPTTPGEVGAYSQSAGAGLAGRLTTAETNITQTATAITSKADKSTVDTLEGIVSTQGTTITQQADLIESKANQSEVDTVKGTVAGHTTTISQHANQIASKAESSLVNTIKGTVDNHATEISQNATDIASKASSSSVNTLTGRVSTAETTISQHATAITSKASQSEVDTVKGTVSGHTTTLSQHASQIASKAESNLVNNIKGTVDTHTTEISQNATDIASKASSSSVNTLTGRVSTAETGISANAEAIKLKANQSTVDTLAGTVSTLGSEFDVVAGQVSSRVWNTDIELAIDDIEIGGRNLFLGTKEFKTGGLGVFVEPIDGFNVMYMDNTSGTSEAQAFTYWFEYERNTEYVMSFWVKGSGQSRFLVSGYDYPIDSISFEGVVGSDGGGVIYFDTPNDWKRVWVKIKTRNWTAEKRTKPTRVNITAGHELYIYGFKMEKGNKATDWTPAPEDTMEIIDHIETEWTQTFDSFSQTVSDINGQVSEQKQTIEGLETTIQSTQSDLSGTKTLLNTTKSTVDGHVSTIATLRTDVDGKATTDQFNTLENTVEGSIQRIGDAEGNIAQIETSVSGLQTTVADKASQSQVTQLANGLSSVVTDLGNLKVGGRNLQRNSTDFTESWRSHEDNPVTITSVTPIEKGYSRVVTMRANSDYYRELAYVLDQDKIDVGDQVTVSFYLNNVVSMTNINVEINGLVDENENRMIKEIEPDTPQIVTFTGYRSKKYTRGYFEILFKADTIYLHFQFDIGRVMVEHGNIASEWVPAIEDTQSQITQNSNNINLRVSKGDVLSQINIEAERTLIQSKKLVLDANSVVFTGNAFIPSAQIVSLHADKINAGTIASARIDAKTIVTEGLAANVVSSNHIIANEALVDKVFSNQASVNRLWAKAIWTNKITAMEIDAGQIKAGTINAARINVTDLRADILTANVVDAVQINGSVALFNKLFSTTSATSRLVAQGAWITNANVISLNADKITAGIISADRISTSSLSNLKVGGRNLQRNSTDFTQGWVERNEQNPVTITVNKIDDVYSNIVAIRTNSLSRRKFAYKLDQGNIEVGDEVTVSFDIVNNITTEMKLNIHGMVDAETNERVYHRIPPNSHTKFISSGVRSTRFTAGFFEIYVESDTMSTNFNFDIGNLKLEKGNKATDWTPAPEDIINDLGSSGTVEIHGGNIKADTLDVGAITGDLGEFINLSLKAQNSQASLSGASFRIESIANNQSYIEMSNAPEIRARSADSSMAVMGQGRTSYHYDGSERFYFGSKLNGWQNGMMIRKHHGWGIMRESDSSNGVPAKYYQVPAGYQRVAVVEALMRDPSVTEVPTGNETQFIINSNYLGRLNGYTDSTSSTVAYPWPTLRTGDLIKYAEEIPGNESGVQQVFDIWDDNNTTVSAFGVHVTFHGGYSGASDRNIKHDIKDTAVEALAHIESLTFKEFRYNQDNRYEPIGIIAQDSGILRVKSDKVESVDIQRSIMLSLKGLQELQDIVKRQEKEINEQAEEIKQLKEIINQ